MDALINLWVVLINFNANCMFTVGLSDMRSTVVDSVCSRVLVQCIFLVYLADAWGCFYFSIINLCANWGVYGQA